MTINPADIEEDEIFLLSYNTVIEAVNENPEAIESVLSHYWVYMRMLSEGNDEIFERLVIRLLLAIPKFKPKG